MLIDEHHEGLLVAREQPRDGVGIRGLGNDLLVGAYAVNGEPRYMRPESGQRYDSAMPDTDA
jgi:hypothetical protein